MRDIHKQRIIQTAIREYKESVLFGFSSSAPHAINMMEEALHMCRPYNVLGISVLENTLKEAKKKYEKDFRFLLVIPFVANTNSPCFQKSFDFLCLMNLDFL